jgi:hypothetical protein
MFAVAPGKAMAFEYVPEGGVFLFREHGPCLGMRVYRVTAAGEHCAEECLAIALSPRSEKPFKILLLDNRSLAGEQVLWFTDVTLMPSFKTDDYAVEKDADVEPGMLLLSGADLLLAAAKGEGSVFVNIGTGEIVGAPRPRLLIKSWHIYATVGGDQFDLYQFSQKK